MSSACAFHRIVFLEEVHRSPHPASMPSASTFFMAPLSRRDALLICTAPINLAAFSPASHARERRFRKSIAIEDYNTTCKFPYFGFGTALLLAELMYLGLMRSLPRYIGEEHSRYK